MKRTDAHDEAPPDEKTNKRHVAIAMAAGGYANG